MIRLFSRCIFGNPPTFRRTKVKRLIDYLVVGLIIASTSVAALIYINYQEQQQQSITHTQLEK
jgi:hypothetical protein